MVVVEGTVTHPFVLNSWKEGAIVLGWDGDRVLAPCEKFRSSEEDDATEQIQKSSFTDQLKLAGLKSGSESWRLEELMENSSSVEHLDGNSLASHGLAVAGKVLYVTEAGKLSNEGLLLCLGEMKINLTAKEGGGCDGGDSEWCATKVFSSFHLYKKNTENHYTIDALA